MKTNTRTSASTRARARRLAKLKRSSADHAARLGHRLGQWIGSDHSTWTHNTCLACCRGVSLDPSDRSAPARGAALVERCDVVLPEMPAPAVDRDTQLALF